MKRLALAGIATFALVLGALAQGTLLVDNSTANNGVADLTALDYYSGAYGLELFELNSPPSGSALTALLGRINGAASGLNGLAAMSAQGFTLENTWLDQKMSGGYLTLGQFTMADAAPAGGNVLLGLAVWNTSTSYATMLATPDAHFGVLAFPQTISATANPPMGVTLPDLGAGWTPSARIWS
jgi:hypothetical protein